LLKKVSDDSAVAIDIKEKNAKNADVEAEIKNFLLGLKDDQNVKNHLSNWGKSRGGLKVPLLVFLKKIKIYFF
jgi:hypothetical protein